MSKKMKVFALVFFFICSNLGNICFSEDAHTAQDTSKKYFYATATGYGIKMRNGPGTSYTENALKLHKNAYVNAPRKILYDDYLFGLIVDNTVVKGDAACSAWQKIVAVHTSWDSSEIIKPLCETENGTNNFKCSETAYICKDFIKTTPIDYNLKNINVLLDSFKKINTGR